MLAVFFGQALGASLASGRSLGHDDALAVDLPQPDFEYRCCGSRHEGGPLRAFAARRGDSSGAADLTSTTMTAKGLALYGQTEAAAHGSSLPASLTDPRSVSIARQAPEGKAGRAWTGVAIRSTG